MDIIPNTLPDDNIVDCNLFILDPLSTIIKLAIISKKPIGTKIYVSENIIHIQEIGIWQGFCRKFINKTNKTDLRFLYNPIYLACKTFLNKEYIDNNKEIVKLFKSAKQGLKCLTETYKKCTIIVLCLYYFISILNNYIDNYCIETLFQKDTMTIHYTKELVDTFNSKWTIEKIKIILDLVKFLEGNDKSLNDVKSLEDIMIGIDNDFKKINLLCENNSK